MEKENWRDICGYDGLYQVSNKGRVRSLRFINNVVNKEKISLKKPSKLKNGYLKVMLYKDKQYKNYTIHRLVADAFIANPESKRFINHKDGNKENNCVENLEWCTATENMRHASMHGLLNPPAKGKFGADSLKAKQVLMLDMGTNRELMRFGSIIDAAHYVGAKKSCHIVSCCKGRLRSAYGYVWKYLQ